MWYIWLIAAGFFFVFEMITVGFLVFWVGVGALLTMCLSFFVSDPVIQTAFFVIVSTLLIFLTKPLVNKFLNSGKTIITNANTIINKKGIVTSDIVSNEKIGLVKIGSETWSAIVNKEATLVKGTEIMVTKIDGVKAVITPIDK